MPNSDKPDKKATGGRELIQPHEKRYQRRNADGTFGKSDDQSKSLSQDVRKSAKAKKPRNQGDKGD
jgi:hypothetical protein